MYNKKEYQKEFRKKNTNYQKEYYHKNKHKYKYKYKKRSQKTRLMYQYKLTVEQFDALICASNGQCAICGHVITKRMCIDHNHKTGKVRGILCSRCNIFLGNARDSVPILLRAIDYLNKQ